MLMSCTHIHSQWRKKDGVGEEVRGKGKHPMEPQNRLKKKEKERDKSSQSLQKLSVRPTDSLTRGGGRRAQSSILSLYGR